VVEVDEFQHAQYDQDCEQTRMVNIQQSLGLYTVFLRFNPDPYKINNKTVPTTSKKRLDHLLSRIKHHYHQPQDKHILAEYLFYNAT
jgi:hypothetical protein